MVYILGFLLLAIVRGVGLFNVDEIMDLIYCFGLFLILLVLWMVNWIYYWWYYFDDFNVYFCGILILVDKMLGIVLFLKGKKIVVIGVFGGFG